MSDTDLNERAGLAERWAARNPALLERAVHSLDAGLLILDATQPGCPIAFANEAFERMTGYSCAEAVGQRCPMLQGPDTDPAAIAELDAALREARAARVTVLNYRKDGTPFWNEVSVSPLRGEDGTLLQHIAFHQDVSAREVALQGLREAELRYRGLVENLVGVVPYVAENDGTASISYIAPQIERLLGYPHGDWLGPRTVWYRALHPDDRERVLAVQRRRFDDGEALDLEYRLIAADGQVHWVSDRDTATASADGAVQRREGMLVDITAIKDAESALARGDERRRSVVESLEEGVLVIGAGGRPVASNPSARRILGADPMEGGFDFRGVDVWLEDGTPVDRANSLGQRALVDGEPVRDVVMRFVRPDGEERWASLNYQPLVVPGEPHHSELVVSFRDITEQRRVTDALRQSEERLRSVIAGAPVHMWAIDTDGYYTLLEGRGLQDLGLTAGELVGQSLFEVFKDAPQACDANRQALEGKQFSRQTELRGLTFESHFSPLRDDDGEVIGALGVAIDITERKRAEERLSHLALHDTLTGLPNRTLFLDRLEHALVRGRREKSHLCVLFIDLDRFKRINDSLGHQSGDQILLETADRIGHALRADDSVSRLGGDEFTVLCEGIRDEDEALAVADKVAEELGQLYDVDDAELYVTASIGVALSDSDSTPEQLLRDADAAMYRAKSRGRDRVELFDEVSRSHTVNRLALEHALHGAVERGEFCLHYQPKVSLATGRVIGFEALLRWQHPERGLLAPDDFISIAEDSGLIVPIGRWVIEEAARQGAAWGAGRESEPVICVNLSARQFAQPDLVQVVAAAVESSGISPGAFCLEITESVVMEQTHATIATLGELKKLGLPLAIDDFGTGYSSLGYLQRFRLDYLKVDRSFVEGLGHDREQTAIVDAIVKMAQALGLRVIAEGVETEEQVETLRALGCDMVQGFLFARPQPPEEAATHLDETVYASAAP